MMLVTAHSASLALPASLIEVAGVFRHIRFGLSELDKLAREAAAMEEELHAFMETYYARVLPLTERLERLRYRKAHGIFPNRRLLLDHTMPKQQNKLEQHKKFLFRALVKRCHPDNHGSDAPIDIEEVYAADTISALWLLHIRCACDTLPSNTEVNAYLEKERMEIGRAMLEARKHNRAVKQGELWELKERVCDAALQGVDLIEQIQQRIEKQITALQQFFVKSRDFQSAA